MKRLESQNELQRFEWEKWDVAANTDFYTINGVSQALYRIYQSQYGDLPGWHEMDKKVRKIMEKCVEQRINSFPPDPPPGHRLVLRPSVLLQLVHLGL